MTALRKGLPDVPAQMRGLPVDDRGYPVPFFVQWMNEDGKPVQRGVGTPDFRVMNPHALDDCVNRGRCWVCGNTLGRYKAFTIGPMCAVNRTSAEPPGHLSCARFSALACPFLARPKTKRREAKMPEGLAEAPGLMIRRNPGVTLVWVTTRYVRFSDGKGGLLFDIGEPESVYWYSQGRDATRAEILHSIDTGLPALQEVAEAHGELEPLAAAVERAMELLPA